MRKSPRRRQSAANFFCLFGWCVSYWVDRLTIMLFMNGRRYWLIFSLLFFGTIVVLRLLPPTSTIRFHTFRMKQIASSRWMRACTNKRKLRTNNMDRGCDCECECGCINGHQSTRTYSPFDVARNLVLCSRLMLLTAEWKYCSQCWQFEA